MCFSLQQYLTVQSLNCSLYLSIWTQPPWELMIQTHHLKVKSSFLPSWKKTQSHKASLTKHFLPRSQKSIFSLTKIISMKLITHKMLQNWSNNILQNVNSPLQSSSKLLWSAPQHVELRPTPSSLLLNISILDFATRSSCRVFYFKIHIDKPNS